MTLNYQSSHYAAHCCAEGCEVCGAGPYEECMDTIDDGDDLEELDLVDIGGVVDGFGNVHSDADLEAPGW